MFLPVDVMASEFLNYAPEGRPGGFWCLPPVRNLRAVSLITLFYISSLIFFCLVLLLFLSLSFWPILLTSFSVNLHFPKGRLFYVALAFSFFLNGEEISTLVGGMCNICCRMALVLAFISLCIYVVFLICDCFCPFFFLIFLIWYWHARPTQSMVPASPNFICHFLQEQYQRD